MTENVNAAQSPVVMYYFFDFNDSAKQKVEGMIRSLVYQLVSKADKIPDVVAHEYKRQHEGRHSAVDSRLAGWVVILQELLENAHKPFIFIDALDECDETEQTLLVSTFQKLLGEKDLLVKWLFTCRPTSLFAGIMAVPGCLHISMQAQVIDKDIHKYFSSRFESDPALSSFPQATKELIASKISARSGGM
jgi:ankyrin repeat domain-containing protein 50